MWQAISAFLAIPTVAYLLLILGINSLLFELGSPGMGFAAGFGGVCIALALVGLSILNANLAGLVLIALAFGLFALDIKAASHGALTAGGLLAMITGSILLFSTANASLPWLAIFGASFGTAAVFIFLVQAAWRSRLRPVVTGKEALIGKVGEARTELRPEGSVWVYGSLWHAVSLDGFIGQGEKVRVMRVEGLTLYVVPAAERLAAAAPSPVLTAWPYPQETNGIPSQHQEEKDHE